MRTYSTESAYRLIIETIQTFPSGEFVTLRELELALDNRHGYTNSNRISLTLRVLIAANILEGVFRGRKLNAVKFLGLGAGSTSTNSNEELVAKLRKELAMALTLAEEAIEHSNQQSNEAKVLEVHTYKTAKTKKPKVMRDCFHQEFQTIVDLAEERENIFIYGPTGCGKSYIAKQLADAIGLRFAFVSCTTGMSEGQIGVRLTPSIPDTTVMLMVYNELLKKKVDKVAAATMAAATASGFSPLVSEFVECYENGGVFLIDEIDAADPNVLLLINTALSNGKLAIPNRPDKPYAVRHPDFVCIASANTVGTGASRMYSGRNALDAATLDRFAIGKVFMDYDPEVEKQLCPDDELFGRCLAIRKAINDHRLERAMSSRFMEKAYKMKTNKGWDHAKIDKAFFQGWREDEKGKVQTALRQHEAKANIGIAPTMDATAKMDKFRAALEKLAN